MAARSILLALCALLSMLSLAVAQPAANPYGPVTQPAPQPAPVAPAPVAQPAPAVPQPVVAAQPAAPGPVSAPQSDSAVDRILRRFTFGFHLFTFSGGLSADSPRTSSESASGYAAFVRFRINPRWELELSANKLSASNREREFRPTALSGLIHLIEVYGVEAYGRVGVGIGGETAVSGTTELSFDATHFHAGVGLQYQVWNNIGVHGELRVEQVNRSGDDGFGASGTQMGLGASYRF